MNVCAGQMDNREASWWKIGFPPPPLARVMGVVRQQQRNKKWNAKDMLKVT